MMIDRAMVRLLLLELLRNSSKRRLSYKSATTSIAINYNLDLNTRKCDEPKKPITAKRYSEKPTFPIPQNVIYLIYNPLKKPAVAGFLMGYSCSVCASAIILAVRLEGTSSYLTKL